jgi:hypothetical protein
MPIKFIRREYIRRQIIWQGPLKKKIWQGNKGKFTYFAYYLSRKRSKTYSIHVVDTINVGFMSHQSVDQIRAKTIL